MDRDSDNPSDEDLAAAAQAGDLDAFESLVHRYEGRLVRFVMQKLANRHDAEDITQATFVKAFRGLGRYHASRRFAPWLYTIAARTAISHLRSRPEPTREAVEEVDHTTPSSIIAAREDGQALWGTARAMLPAREFEALWLMYGESFRVKEIARVTGLTAGHVKVLLHRARRKLAHAMEQGN